MINMGFADNVLNALYEDNIHITYTSITSGRELDGVYTLKGDKRIQQRNASDTIVCWDIKNNIWQDIRKETITTWIRVIDW